MNIKTQNPEPEKPTADQSRSLPLSEKQSNSGANAVCRAAGSRPTHIRAAVPSRGPRVLSPRAAPVSLPGLGLSRPPARGPRRPASGSAAAAIGASLPQKGAHWPGGKSFAQRIPPPAGLRGNFLIIVTPKTEKPRAWPAGLSQSESRAAARQPPRYAGRGPGFQGRRHRGAAAARPPRSAGHG